MYMLNLCELALSELTPDLSESSSVSLTQKSEIIKAQ